MQNGLGVYWKMAISSAIAVSDFSPPESSSTLCSFLPGGEATISMPDSASVLFVCEAHLADSAAKQTC